MASSKRAGPIRMLQNLWRTAAPEVIVTIGYLIMMAWIWTSTHSLWSFVYPWIVLAEVIYWFGWTESSDTWRYSRYESTVINKAGTLIICGLLMGMTLLVGWIVITGLREIYHNLPTLGVGILVVVLICSWIWFNSLKYKKPEPTSTKRRYMMKEPMKKVRKRKTR